MGIETIATNKPEVLKYEKSPAQVAGLRQMCLAWQREFGFWSFDEIRPVLARAGSLVFFVPAAPSPDAQESLWDAALLVDKGPFEADILYIYVKPERRRDQLAKKMFDKLVETLSETANIEAVFLEVRISNTPAIGLYEKLGMTRQFVRKKYYPNGEDALVYKLEIPRTSK